jgi:hypothetical protein
MLKQKVALNVTISLGQFIFFKDKKSQLTSKSIGGINHPITGPPVNKSVRCNLEVFYEKPNTKITFYLAI